MSTDFEKKQWGVKALGITYRYNGHIISASMRVQFPVKTLHPGT